LGPGARDESVDNWIAGFRSKPTHTLRSRATGISDALRVRARKPGSGRHHHEETRQLPKVTARADRSGPGVRGYARLSACASALLTVSIAGKGKGRIAADPSTVNPGRREGRGRAIPISRNTDGGRHEILADRGDPPLTSPGVAPGSRSNAAAPAGNRVRRAGQPFGDPGLPTGDTLPAMRLMRTAAT
jgi:hypothetical protein